MNSLLLVLMLTFFNGGEQVLHKSADDCPYHYSVSYDAGAGRLVVRKTFAYQGFTNEAIKGSTVLRVIEVQKGMTIYIYPIEEGNISHIRAAAIHVIELLDCELQRFCVRT